MRAQWTRMPALAVAALFFMSVGANGVAAQQDQAIPRDTLEQTQQDTLQQAQIDAPSGYQNASEVTGLPQFVEGLGILFVQQENLPVGPFLAYNPDGELVSTVLFLPTSGTGTMQGQQPGYEQQGQQEQEWRQEDERQREQEREDEWGQQQQQEQQQQGMQQQQLDLSQFSEMALEEEQVDHLEIKFNRGFSMASSGLDQPHYQVILWHVSKDEARELQQMGMAQHHAEQREYGQQEQQREYGQREEQERRDREREAFEAEQQQQEQQQQQEEAAGVAMDVDIDAPEGFERASEIAQLPEFVPNLGILYVEPDNVPVGPYLAYDREGQQVSTVLFLPAEGEGMTGQQQPGYEQQQQRQEDERQREQEREDEWGQQRQEQQAQQEGQGMPRIDMGKLSELELEESDIDHMAIEFSQGLTGATSPLDRPHYRVVLWHVSPEDARNVSRFQGDRQENR